MNITSRNKKPFLTFLLFLGVISIFIATAVHQAIQPPWWIDVGSPVAVFILLYELFEYRAWKWKVFRWLGVVDFPNLSGRWEGHITSTYQTNSKPTQSNICLEIEQNASRIFVRAFTEQSASDSTFAGFGETSGHRYLYYAYDNDPNPQRNGTMNRHYGFTKLEYIENGKRLQGSYFNSLTPTANSGVIELEYRGSSLFARFKK